MSSYLKDRDLLQLAEESDDVISLCYEASRRHGVELTLKQAEKLMERIEEVCIDHPECELDEDGYCAECEKPYDG